MIVTKIHKTYRNVVAMCDAELVGMYFEEGKKQLDVRESFYKGDEISFKQAIELLKDQSKEDATFNLIGPKTIKAALKAELISQESVLYVQKVPFTLILI
jgi:hypothetical protein